MASVPRTASSLLDTAFERILLIKPSSLGDLVHALPVLQGLRHRFPQATIDWLIATQFMPLVDGHEDVDELIPFDRRRFGQIGRSPRAAAEFVGFLRSLRARRYDLAIDLQGLFRTGFIARLSGAPVRIGFEYAREGAGFFYTHRVRLENPDLHAVERNYRVSELLGFDDVPISFNLNVSAQTRADARALFGNIGLGSQQQFVAVAPGARWETKVWPPERFTETIDELHKQCDLRCILLGSRDETSLCERIAKGCCSSPINLAGRTALPLLAAVIELADLVLSHDSAAMHLAVALSRPLVCLVGPTNPARTGPYRRGGDVVRLKLDCAPCYLRRLSRCRHGHRCMRELPVEMVVAAVKQRLAQHCVNVD